MQYLDHDLGKPVEDGVPDGRNRGKAGEQQLKSQRNAFLHEVEAMIRLRNPHTVNVYGAITSLPDRLILVMELLVGGDLRNVLKHAEHPLPEHQSRQIIRDVCAGMAFLHSKATVHGDLKSCNILLDGCGRAKVCMYVCMSGRWVRYFGSILTFVGLWALPVFPVAARLELLKHILKHFPRG